MPPVQGNSSTPTRHHPYRPQAAPAPRTVPIPYAVHMGVPFYIRPVSFVQSATSLPVQPLESALSAHVPSALQDVTPLEEASSDSQQTVPSQRPSIPQQPPTSRQVPPVQRQVAPVQRQVPPGQHQVPPVQRQVPLVQRQVLTVQQQVLSVQRQVPPVQRQVPPVQQQAPLVQRQVPLVQRQVPPVQGQVHQVQHQVHPGQRQVPPAHHQALPIQSQVPPVQHTRHPQQQQVNPSSAPGPGPGPASNKQGPTRSTNLATLTRHYPNLSLTPLRTINLASVDWSRPSNNCPYLHPVTGVRCLIQSVQPVEWRRTRHGARHVFDEIRLMREGRLGYCQGTIVTSEALFQRYRDCWFFCDKCLLPKGRTARTAGIKFSLPLGTFMCDSCEDQYFAALKRFIRPR